MSDPESLEWLDEPADVAGALVLVALPTTGQVATIAAQYLVQSLQLPLVGSLWPDGMQGLVSIDDGRVTSPLRIYGGEVACELDGGCPRVFLVTTHLTISPDIQAEVVDAVTEWATAGAAARVLFLEGVIQDDDESEPQVYCAARGAPALGPLEQLQIPLLERGLLVGPVALFLQARPTAGPHRGALLVEADPEQPDGRAAAALIKVLDRLIPHVTVDAEPLLEEALALERALAKEAAGPTGGHTSTFI